MNNFKQSSFNIFLLAAGIGTRLRPTTLSTPKPAIPFFKKPLGYYSLPYLESININRFVINTFHLPEKIKDCYSRITHLNNKIYYSDEVDFIKDSAGGMKQAEPFLSTTDHFIAINSDEIFFTENNQFLNKALEQHIQNKALATLVTIKHPEAGHKFGAIWVEKNNLNVKTIGKFDPLNQKQNGNEPWHYIGVQILSKDIFNYIKPEIAQNIFYDVLNFKTESHTIQIFKLEADWYEVGNLVDYSLAKKDITQELETKNYYKKHFESLKKYPDSDLSDLA